MTEQRETLLAERVTIWRCPECGGYWTYDHGSDHESWIRDADGVGAACMGEPIEAEYVPVERLEAAQAGCEEAKRHAEAWGELARSRNEAYDALAEQVEGLREAAATARGAIDGFLGGTAERGVQIPGIRAAFGRVLDQLDAALQGQVVELGEGEGDG